MAGNEKPGCEVPGVWLHLFADVKAEPLGKSIRIVGNDLAQIIANTVEGVVLRIEGDAARECGKTPHERKARRRFDPGGKASCRDEGAIAIHGCAPVSNPTGFCSSESVRARAVSESPIAE